MKSLLKYPLSLCLCLILIPATLFTPQTAGAVLFAPTCLPNDEVGGVDCVMCYSFADPVCIGPTWHVPPRPVPTIHPSSWDDFFEVICVIGGGSGC